jgi:FkbM family methyltransferase
VRVDGGLGSGLRLSLRDLPLSHAHAGLLPRGQLELPVQEALRRLLGPGMVFYDVGANIGFFTLVAGRICGPRGAVVAFEPVPSSAAAVRENAALNGLANVTVLQCAAGERSGRAALSVPDDASWARLASGGERGDVEVEVVAVDQLVEAARIPPPHVVKLDVEGAELGALRGMRRTLTAHAPAVICELHGTAREFVELMGELGYRVEGLEGPAAVADAAGEVRALALPPGR